ncbi:hypothetical protein H2248_006759 [Termitomyces sp. 'cryptogamus']|nr:hypothetical protein H2248_006759 [Termitomyces sp. 'cryptogamus']
MRRGAFSEDRRRTTRIDGALGLTSGYSVASRQGLFRAPRRVIVVYVIRPHGSETHCVGRVVGGGAALHDTRQSLSQRLYGLRGWCRGTETGRCFYVEGGLGAPAHPGQRICFERGGRGQGAGSRSRGGSRYGTSGYGDGTCSKWRAWTVSAMDSLQSAFDLYAPRTPSPHDAPFLPVFKQPVAAEPRIYEGADDDDPAPVDAQFFAQQPFYCPRGSLLQELYEHDLEQQQQQQPAYEQQQQQQPAYEQWQQPQPQPPQQYHMVRRATFPYVRHDRDGYSHGLYGEPIPENAAIKLEDTPSLVVPSQQAFYSRPSSYHAGLPVQHTDDAASKETQYLRRRCFNCHTTEPPSWRRSTLNPGKIVCNKCGLYERTHLRPRPLRFDELRAGNKARANKSKPSPKAAIKKEPREIGLVRRSSVSSSSDWDDNGKSRVVPMN